MEFLPRTDKITRVLTLYHQLHNGQHIEKTLFSLEHGINERSFDRDIEDIRLFLSESYSGREVVFDRETGTYGLTGDSPVFLDRMDATAIAKLLLSSEALRKDEMMGLYQTVLSSVTPADAAVINDYLQHDLSRYAAKTESALLKILCDLYVTIRSGSDIEITIRTDDEETVTIPVSPIEIETLESRLYLMGAENLDITSLVRYPLDRIDSYKTLHSAKAGNIQYEYHQQKLGNARIFV